MKIKKNYNIFLVALVILVFHFLGATNAHAENVIALPINVEYRQSEARSIFHMINDLRTSETDAWYWDSSDTERVECQGLRELNYSYDLEKVAMKRAAEIAVSYGHTRPNGESCFSAYEEEQIKYSSAGENIAAGYNSAYEVNLGWREDDKSYSGQGHRRNMLGKSFNCVGIGCVYYNDTLYWVEEFGNTQSIGDTTIANDSNTLVNVRVLEDWIQGKTIEAIENYENSLNCGQTVKLPKCAVRVSVSGNWSYSGACPINADISYSLSTSENATLKDSYLTVYSPGTVLVTITSGDLRGQLKYNVSHDEKILPAVEATTSHSGLTEGLYCPGCNTTLEEQKVIPKLEIEDKTSTTVQKPSASEQKTSVKKYKINKTSASLKTGKELTLKVYNASGSVKWSSGNKNIATVNQQGVVKAKKSGTVTIKAYCKKLNKTVSCKIEVYKSISQEQVTKDILKLKSKYKEGMHWTNEDNNYYWKALNCHCYGCIAFVGEVSDKIFGKNAKIKTHKSFDKIKPGDHIRIGGYHSVIVISKNGDTLTVAEGNYNSSVHWGRKITKSSLKQSGFYVNTRY